MQSAPAVRNWKARSPPCTAVDYPARSCAGVTFFLPEGDAISASRQKLESQISTLYGGRLASNDNDIKVATNPARNMVTQWGFSDKLGPLLYAEEEGEVFLGRSVAKAKHMSDETARIIDRSEIAD